VIRWQHLGPRHLTPRTPPQRLPSAAWAAYAKMAQQPHRMGRTASAWLATRPAARQHRMGRQRHVGPTPPKYIPHTKKASDGGLEPTTIELQVKLCLLAEVYIYIKTMLVRVAFYIRNVQNEEHLYGSSFSFLS
jgi:hypothetical protein